MANQPNTGAKGPMTQKAQQFLLEEFKALRSEIEIAIKHLHTLIFYSLLTSGVVWAWLFKIRHDFTYPMLGWIPPVLALLIAFRAQGVRMDVKRIGFYIALVEKEMSLPAGLGWETFLNKRGWRSWLGLGDYAHTCLLVMVILANIAAAYVYYYLQLFCATQPAGG